MCEISIGDLLTHITVCMRLLGRGHGVSIHYHPRMRLAQLCLGTISSYIFCEYFRKYTVTVHSLCPMALVGKKLPGVSYIQ